MGWSSFPREDDECVGGWVSWADLFPLKDVPEVFQAQGLQELADVHVQHRHCNADQKTRLSQHTTLHPPQRPNHHRIHNRLQGSLQAWLEHTDLLKTLVCQI